MKITKNKEIFYTYLDIIAIFLWSILLFKYWITGQLNLLIHPNYFLLVFISSIILFILSIVLIINNIIKPKKSNYFSSQNNDNQHTNLLPKGWASVLLIIVATSGLVIQPTVLSSQTALQRGVSESLPPTTVETQSFLAQTPPEERSLIEWVRTLNTYPEPDNYKGQKANLNGFVVHLDHLPDNYIYLSRFVLTCCAVDAYPVGIPVKLPTSRKDYPPDIWLEVKGVMKTETLPAIDSSSEGGIRDKRQLVLDSEDIKEIPTPPNPYSY